MVIRISILRVHAQYKCYNVGVYKFVFKCVDTSIHACLWEYVLYRVDINKIFKCVCAYVYTNVCTVQFHFFMKRFEIASLPLHMHYLLFSIHS